MIPKTTLLAVSILAAIGVPISSPKADPEPVASFGAWQLYEGLFQGTGDYVCGIAIGGYVRGFARHINIYQTRNSTLLKVQVWQGQYVGAETRRVVMTFKFSDGAITKESAQEGPSIADATITNPTEFTDRVRIARSMEVDVDGFFPLTADLDGTPEALDAMDRCHNGETITNHRPLR
jgi:hypothetical protein